MKKIKIIKKSLLLLTVLFSFSSLHATIKYTVRISMSPKTGDTKTTPEVRCDGENATVRCTSFGNKYCPVPSKVMEMSDCQDVKEVTYKHPNDTGDPNWIGVVYDAQMAEIELEIESGKY